MCVCVVCVRVCACAQGMIWNPLLCSVKLHLCRDPTEKEESTHSLVFVAKGSKPIHLYGTCTQPAMTAYLPPLLLSRRLLGAFYKLEKCFMFLGTNH